MDYAKVSYRKELTQNMLQAEPVLNRSNSSSQSGIKIIFSCAIDLDRDNRTIFPFEYLLNNPKKFFLY